MLPEKIPLLEVSIDGAPSGQLIKRSTYEFRYLDPRPEQPAAALLMPASTRATWEDGDLFPVMDQNLPEGDLFARLRAMFPKQPMTPMHLLARGPPIETLVRRLGDYFVDLAGRNRITISQS